MPIAYIVVIAVISTVSVALGAMIIVGFIQGILEDRAFLPEEPTYDESLLFPNRDQTDTVYTNVWGTHSMYSKTDSTGKTTYYDPFGTQIGRSERRF